MHAGRSALLRGVESLSLSLSVCLRRRRAVGRKVGSRHVGATLPSWITVLAAAELDELYNKYTTDGRTDGRPRAGGGGGGVRPTNRRRWHLDEAINGSTSVTFCRPAVTQQWDVVDTQRSVQ